MNLIPYDQNNTEESHKVIVYSFEELQDTIPKMSCGKIYHIGLKSWLNRLTGKWNRQMCKCVRESNKNNEHVKIIFNAPYNTISQVNWETN